MQKARYEILVKLSNPNPRHVDDGEVEETIPLHRSAEDGGSVLDGDLFTEDEALDQAHLKLFGNPEDWGWGEDVNPNKKYFYLGPYTGEVLMEHEDWQERILNATLRKVEEVKELDVKTYRERINRKRNSDPSYMRYLQMKEVFEHVPWYK